MACSLISSRRSTNPPFRAMPAAAPRRYSAAASPPMLKAVAPTWVGPLFFFLKGLMLSSASWRAVLVIVAPGHDQTALRERVPALGPPTTGAGRRGPPPVPARSRSAQRLQ